MHRRSCYRDLGDLGPPWQGKELVYQEPESIEVLSSKQGNQFMMLRRLSFSYKCMSLFIILWYMKALNCPKCCTNLYQEWEKVPSLENASTTPMSIGALICWTNHIKFSKNTINYLVLRFSRLFAFLSNKHLSKQQK